MSDFNTCLDFVLENEGGFAIDVDGAANYGITAKYLMDIGAWQYDFDKDGIINADDMKKFTKCDAISEYKAMFYRNYYNILDNTDLVKRVFDMRVNAGTYRANRILQASYNITKSMGVVPLAEDGILGKKTIGVINDIKSNQTIFRIIRQYKKGREKYYKGLVEGNPTKYQQYAEGWYKRAYL